MTITTKYNVGDTVWFMNSNKPTEQRVLKIEIHLTNKEPKIHYHMRYGIYNEEDIFPSKEELIASL